MIPYTIITVEGKYIFNETSDIRPMIMLLFSGPLAFRKVDARSREVAIYQRGAGRINEVATNKCTGAIVGHCVILNIDAFEHAGFDNRHIE